MADGRIAMLSRNQSPKCAGVNLTACATHQDGPCMCVGLTLSSDGGESWEQSTEFLPSLWGANCHGELLHKIACGLQNAHMGRIITIPSADRHASDVCLPSAATHIIAFYKCRLCACSQWEFVLCDAVLSRTCPHAKPAASVVHKYWALLHRSCAESNQWHCVQGDEHRPD
jgi:hypothetical protein